MAGLNEPDVLQAIRSLIRLIPTDPAVVDTLDAVSYHSESAHRPAASADASPKLSPRKPVSSNVAGLMEAKAKLAKLFDATAEHMNPFRVLYNLEVLSSRLMPTKHSNNSYLVNASQQFCADFVNAGGLGLILGVLERTSMPADVDYDLRQNAYLVALQLSDYLLCGDGGLDSNSAMSSPVIKPTPPKRSALDSSAVMQAKSPAVISATKVSFPSDGFRRHFHVCQHYTQVVQTMREVEFCAVVACLMRVVWAAAAGNLSLASTSIPSAHSSDTRLYAVRRSRDNSTGSSGSESGSSDPTGAGGSGSFASSGTQQAQVSGVDALIAGRALELMVTCLQTRTNVLASFYSLPLVSEFIVDIVLGSTSADVRRDACKQLIKLSKVKVTARALDMDSADGNGSSGANRLPSPAQFLTKIIINTPVPLWMPSCKARSISHTILGQCTEYFELRCSLIGGLSKRELEYFAENATDMIEDEVNFLHNFSPCPREEDCVLLAGHLGLVEALLSCEGVDKVKVGSALIQELLNAFLFPASKVMSSSTSSSRPTATDCNVAPKCDTPSSRAAAYRLLAELGRQCPENYTVITRALVAMHHAFDQSLVTEFEYEPDVERRGASDFVGLKNAGATCYMNSVLQQLFCTPGVSEQILSVDSALEEDLDEETVFYQLQNVFGHLHESKLQFYKPEKFWTCFRLFGQPVNVREQQDAFEFFTQVIDQVDEYLAKRNKTKIFSRKFEGVFSDQKICQGCPHRYEREQNFVALNLTVKSNNLQESLDQFVKGELLEGDNAYFCEKCGIKRNTIKRMCIR